VGADVRVTTMLFALNSNVVVPNWFGIAVPDGIQDFTRPNIFFHPTPGQALSGSGQPLYPDSAYATKGAHWPDLFYYMERLGKQVAGAGRSQIVIMPFMTNSATDTGILPAIWHDTVTDILTQVRAAMGADDGSTLSISQVVVSSFSDGIIYSHSFRARSTDVNLAEIWDFDGGLSTYNSYSAALESDPHTVIQYDSASPSYSRSFHLPPPRWADFYDTAAIPKNVSQVHPLIRDFMFLDAASISTVGSLIAPPAPVAVPQATPPNGGQPQPAPTAPLVVPMPGPLPSPRPTPGITPQTPPSPIPALPSPPLQVTPTAPFSVPAVPAPMPPVAGMPDSGTSTPQISNGSSQQTSNGSEAGTNTPGVTAYFVPPPNGDAGCCVAVLGIVAAVAATAQAAMVGITAIASLGDQEGDE
jgi:hypothetical protein